MDSTAISIYLLGAHSFMCLDVVLRSVLRISNYEDYSLWQRHLYACWGCAMFYLLLHIVWNFIVYYYQIDPHSPICSDVRAFSALAFQFCGVTLWTLTSHEIITMKRVMRHFVPFFIVVLAFCVVRRYYPDFKLLFFLLIFMEITYCAVMTPMLIRNSQNYHYSLSQSYTDMHRRSVYWIRNLVWIFLIAGFLYAYFYWFNKLDYIYYPLIICCWYYISYNVLSMRDTSEVEHLLREQREGVSAAEGEELSLEQTMRRIEETLEDICVDRRLFLDPDLTVNDLARELNTNRSVISQYFSAHHTTFLKYINDLRAEYAMYQLKNSSNDLTSVMRDSGFAHYETFARSFQERYNCLPNSISRKG